MSSQSGEKTRRGRKPKAPSSQAPELLVSKARVEPELRCLEEPGVLGLIVKEEPSCIELVQDEEEQETKRQVRSKKIKRVAKEYISQTQTAAPMLPNQSDSAKGEAPVGEEAKPCTCKNGRCAKKYCVCLKKGGKCDPALCTCRDCENLDSVPAEDRR